MKISIEGHIGSNLSAYLLRLSKDGYLVNFEPQQTHSQLATKFQQDIGRYAFSHFLEILNNYEDFTYHPNQLNLYERSTYTSQQIFEKLAFECQMIDPDEHVLYNRIYNRYSWQPDVIIYLYSQPETTYELLNQTDPSISLEYLRRLHVLHEFALDEHHCTRPIYKVNAQDNPEDVYKCLKEILETLKKTMIKPTI